MRGAKPHNEAAKKRKLGNNMEITGDYSIQFKSCFSLTTSYDDMWEDNQNQGSMTMNLFSSGELMALESYAIFALYYMGTAEEYIIDLNTYVQSLVNYLPDQMEEYCQACEENWETCEVMLYGQYGKRDDDMYQKQQQYNANDNNYNGNNVNNVNYNYGGNRKLSSIERVLQGNQEVRQLDCGLCVEYNCVNDDDNQAEGMGYEDAAEWLTELAECKETGIAYSGGYASANGYYYQQQGDEGAQLFAGMICNGDGSGIEIGMFYDEECKLYLPNEAYSKYMSYYDQTYQSMTKEVIEFTFSDAVLGCAEQEVVYTTQDLSNYNQYYGQNYNYDRNQNQEVAEWCEGVIMGENYPVDVNTCGNGYNNYNNYQYSNQIDDDDQISKLANYNWYRYEISEDNSIDMGVVCSVVKENGMHTFYNTANGNLYEYAGYSEEVEEFVEATGADVSYLSGLSGGAKFAIVAAVGIVIGAIVALYIKFTSATEDDKNVGLIDPEEVETKGGEVA